MRKQEEKKTPPMLSMVKRKGLKCLVVSSLPGNERGVAAGGVS